MPLQRLPAAGGLTQQLTDGAGQLRRFQQHQPEPQEEVARLVVEEGFRRRAAAVVREEHLSDGEQVTDPMHRARSHGSQGIPSVTASRLVERGERVDRLAMLGAVARRDVVVLALDVQHHDRVRPVQQVRDDDPDALATASGRGQHRRQLTREREEASLEAPDQDAGQSAFLPVAPQAGALHLGGGRKSRIPVQRPRLACGQDQRERQHDQQRHTRCCNRANELLAPLRVIGVGLPVDRDAVELCMAGVHLVQQQEDDR